jgi:hypothetical protein
VRDGAGRGRARRRWRPLQLRFVVAQ